MSRYHMPMDYNCIVIIYNPQSTGDSEQRASELADTLQKHMKDLRVELVATEHAGHAKELAYKTARSETQPLIVSSSGDGGYNEVVNGVMAAANPQAVCAVLPAGNANDHSRTMQDRPLAESIVKQHVTKIDLLQFTIKKDGKQQVRYAHSYGGLGLTPVVAVELNKHSLNAFKEAFITLKTFFRYRPFKIRHDGKVYRFDSLVFGNINQMAKVLTIAPHNRPADGKFEVVAFPGGRKWGLVKRLAQAVISKPDEVLHTSNYQFEVIKRMPMQLDGEVIILQAGSRVTVQSLPAALATIV